MGVPYEHQFHFRDGASCATLEELKEKIERISYQEFYHHVNANKNDFASWIQHVLHEETLAADLHKVTSIVETVEIMNDFLHPRPATSSVSDTQSRIEQSVLGTPVSVSRAEEQVVVEEVPSAAQNHTPNKHLDFRIIQEKIEQPTAVREELFHRPTTPTPATETPAATVEQHPNVHDPELTKMIVKDFIFGFVFGLLIGLILGKILA